MCVCVCVCAWLSVYRRGRVIKTMEFIGSEVERKARLVWRLESHSFVTSSFKYQPMDGASAPRSPIEGQSVRRQVWRRMKNMHAAWRTVRAREKKERWNDETICLGKEFEKVVASPWMEKCWTGKNLESGKKKNDSERWERWKRNGGTRIIADRRCHTAEGTSRKNYNMWNANGKKNEERKQRKEESCSWEVKRRERSWSEIKS